MRELDVTEMENLKGGGFLGCVGLVAAGVGAVALIAAAHATGGLSFLATASLMGQGLAVGWGIGQAAYDCFLD